MTTSWRIPVTEHGNLVQDGYRPHEGDRMVTVVPAEPTPAMIREGARALDLWSDESLREEIDAYRMAELVLRAANGVASPRQRAK